jgi:hypothetical protein
LLSLFSLQAEEKQVLKEVKSVQKLKPSPNATPVQLLEINLLKKQIEKLRLISKTKLKYQQKNQTSL